MGVHNMYKSDRFTLRREESKNIVFLYPRQVSHVDVVAVILACSRLVPEGNHLRPNGLLRIIKLFQEFPDTNRIRKVNTRRRRHLVGGVGKSVLEAEA